MKQLFEKLFDNSELPIVIYYLIIDEITMDHYFMND